jgi:hypothetical protein
VLLQLTFETTKGKLENVYDDADGEVLTVPIQRADNDNKEEKLGTTNNADGEECRNDRERTDYATTKVI